MNFTNTAGGGFFTAANWTDAATSSVHQVPDASDHACIPSTITGAVTFSTGASDTIAGIDAQGNGGFTLSSGTLTLTDATRASSIANLKASDGTLAGEGSLSLSGSVTWSGGTMSGSGSTTVASGATVSLTYGVLDRGLTNDGTIVVSGTGLAFGSSAVLTNAAAGVIDLVGNTDLGNAYGVSGSVANSGTIDRTSGTGTASIKVALTNKTTGKLDVAVGPLSVASLTNGGTVTVGSQALDVTGTYTSSAKAVLAIDVASGSEGTVHVGGNTTLGGELAITTAPGYLPAVGTGVTVLSTTGHQTGSFKDYSGQVIATTTTGWRVTTGAPSVILTVKPLADVAATITAPTSATVGVPFTLALTITDNGPKSATASTLSMNLPANVTVNGSLPAGCTQPKTTSLKCTAGTLAKGASATFTISVVSVSTGTAVFDLKATTTACDAVGTNNTQEASVKITS